MNVKISSLHTNTLLYGVFRFYLPVNPRPMLCDELTSQTCSDSNGDNYIVIAYLLIQPLALLPSLFSHTIVKLELTS